MCLSRWVTGSIIDISSFALVSIRIKEISTYVHHYPIMQSLCFLSQHRLRTVRPREHFQWVNFAFRQVSFKQHPWSRIFPSEIIHGDCKFNWGWKSYNHKELCSASVLGAAQDTFISLHFCREYFDHCCSSEGFVASSAVETFAQLSGEHRFGRGPHTHPPTRWNPFVSRSLEGLVLLLIPFYHHEFVV